MTKTVFRHTSHAGQELKFVTSADHPEHLFLHVKAGGFDVCHMLDREQVEKLVEGMLCAADLLAGGTGAVHVEMIGAAA